MKRKCHLWPTSQSKKEKRRVRRQIEAVERALEHEKNSGVVPIARRNDAQRTRGGEELIKGVLAAARMAYIGSGDFELTANKCTSSNKCISSFVAVFVDLGRRKMSQSERVCASVPSSGFRSGAKSEDIRNA